MSREIAEAYVAELRKRREAYDPNAVGALQALFKRRDRRPPGVFHESSFLYVRSYDGDAGVRPFSGIDHWRSPDVTLSPVTGVGAYTTTLQAGESYAIRVALRNRGDLAVPSAKVELFLTDPTIGFDVRFATRLTGLAATPSVWVPPLGSAAAEFVYAVPPTESGHKCLFARTFSLSPREIPLDDFALEPRVDRHVAQQNLNIVGQAQAFAFQIVRRPAARLRIALRPMEPEALLAIRHPVLADVTPAREFPRRGWGRLAPIEMLDPGGEAVELGRTRDGVTLIADERSEFGLDAQREIEAELQKVLAAVAAGETTLARHRDLLAKRRAMTAEARLTRLAIGLPDLDLRPGEAVGLDLVGLDDNGERPETVGGLTLVIVGA